MDGISCIAVDWSTMNAYTGGITGQLRLWHVGERPCLLDEDAHSTQVRCLCVDIQDAPRQSRELFRRASPVCQSASDVEADQGELPVVAPASPSEPAPDKVDSSRVSPSHA